MATRTQTTNFIRHQLMIRELFVKDERLSPFHVSLYFALFFEWNENRFQNPFSIFRPEILKASKIGNANTYTKCLKELDLFGYIDYMPSFNSNIGSTVYLYTFDKGTDKGTDKVSDKGSDKGGVQVVIPFNKQKKQNKTKETLSNFSGVVLKKNDQAQKVKVDKSIFLKQVVSKGGLHSPEHTSDQAPDMSKVKSHIPPLLDSVKSFFLEKKSTELESEKFFNHFESNGWLVGGKTKMKNWQAAARNWMLNAQKYNASSFNSDNSMRLSKGAGNLHVIHEKDYNIPL